MAAPAFERVSPSTSVDRRTLRPIALIALGLALACVVAVVLSGPQHQSPYTLQEGAMMPDPAEAVASAAETVSSVAPFHDASDDPLGIASTNTRHLCLRETLGKLECARLV